MLMFFFHQRDQFPKNIYFNYVKFTFTQSTSINPLFQKLHFKVSRQNQKKLDYLKNKIIIVLNVYFHSYTKYNSNEFHFLTRFKSKN